MIDHRTFELHIFDLDDTLINTRYSYTVAQERAVRAVFRQVKSEGLSQILPDLKWLCRQFGSGKPDEYFKALITSRSSILDPGPDSLQKLLEAYRHEFDSLLCCFESAKDYLQLLKSQGKTMALVSNGNPLTQVNKLKRVGLIGYFDEELVFVSGNYPPSQKKPSPHMIKEACRVSNISADKAVFYGNNTSDMLAGNLAGVATIHYNGSTELTEGIPELAKPSTSIDSWKSMLE